MTTKSTWGIAVVLVAMVASALLGSLGWFAVGFGLMTDCTGYYSCTETGCPPCGTTAAWINSGGVAQWLLVGVGAVVLAKRRRVERRVHLGVVGVVMLVVAVATVVGTTAAASRSYCQPGSAGYAESYCDARY